LDKTIEFLDAIGTYDKMFVYRTFSVPSTENVQSMSSRAVGEKTSKKNSTKSTFVGMMILVALIVVFVFGLNSYLTYKHDKEVQEKTQYNANMFLLSIINAISNLEKGMYEIKGGFDEYQDRNNSHTDLDTVMKPYLSKAEWYWDMAETDLSEAFDSMSALKKLIDDKTYDHFVDMYASTREYKEAVSPYGKNSMQYNNDVSGANTMIHNAIARFKSYIYPITNEE